MPEENESRKLSAEDVRLHHFSLTFETHEIKDRLSKKIKFLFICGCPRRARNFVQHLQDCTFDGLHLDLENVEKLTKDESRFDLYKIGPVLVANHGMGSPSMSIAMHELLLLIQLAGSLDDVTVIRFGTCKSNLCLFLFHRILM